MKLPAAVAACFLLWLNHAAADIAIPYSHINAPVVHAGRYHVLSCGDTYCVLDGARGYEIERISFGDIGERGMDDADTVLGGIRLAAILDQGIAIDQALDPDARLIIVEQGANHVAARIECALRDASGAARAQSSIDISLTGTSVHLVPRIAFHDSSTTVTTAGLEADVPGRNAGIIMNGALFMPNPPGRHMAFPDSGSFAAMVTNPGRGAVKIGWLDTAAAVNDSLAEPGSVMPGDSLDWRRSPSAGFSVRYDRSGLKGVSVRWVSDDSLSTAGEPLVLSGALTMCLGADNIEAQRRWNRHVKPLAPSVAGGVGWMYNHTEGMYEITEPVDSLDLVFDNIDGVIDYDFVIRAPLSGDDAVSAAVNGRSVVPALFSDAPPDTAASGRTGTDERQYAIIGVPVQHGGRAHLTLVRREGLRFVYRSRSRDELFELRSPYNNGGPLLGFSPVTGVLSELDRPESTAGTAASLSLVWTDLEQGLDLDGCRGFHVVENGPGRIGFTWDAVTDGGFGLSTTTVTVPLDASVLSLDVDTRFMPITGAHDWNSLEYASVMFASGAEPAPPVASMIPSAFAWLDSTGIFRSWPIPQTAAPGAVGETGIEEPPEPVSGVRSGLLWMAGFPDGDDSILFLLDDYIDALGAYPGFTPAAGLDGVSNFIAGRADSSATGSVSYTLTLFKGPLPDAAGLDLMYRDAAPEGGARPVGGVRFAPDGRLTGFVVGKE